MRQRRRKMEVRDRIVPIGLNGSLLPPNRLLVATEEVFCVACDRQPEKHPRVARTKTKGLLNVDLGLRALIQVKLVQTDYRVSHGKVSIKRKSSFALGNCHHESIGKTKNQAHSQVA